MSQLFLGLGLVASPLMARMPTVLSTCASFSFPVCETVFGVEVLTLTVCESPGMKRWQVGSESPLVGPETLTISMGTGSSVMLSKGLLESRDLRLHSHPQVKIHLLLVRPPSLHLHEEALLAWCSCVAHAGSYSHRRHPTGDLCTGAALRGLGPGRSRSIYSFILCASGWHG